MPAWSKTSRKDDDREAERREVGEGDRRHQVERRDQRSQQQRQHHPDRQQDQRQHHPRVAVARRPRIGLRGGFAADQHAARDRALPRRRRLRASARSSGTTSSEASENGLSVSTTSMRAVPPSAETKRAAAGGGPPAGPPGRSGRAEGAARSRGARDRRVAGEGERQRVELLEALGVQHLLARRQRDVDARRRELARGEALAQQLEAADGLGVAREAGELVVVRLEGEEAGDEQRERRRRGREGGARPAQHDAADAAVDAAPPVLRRLGLLGRLEVQSRLHRPEDAPPDDGQHRRDQRQRRQHHQPDGDRDHRAERLVGAQDRERQRRRGDEDRRARRGDGAAHPAHRAAHRLVLVGVAGQLLAESARRRRARSRCRCRRARRS